MSGGAAHAIGFVLEKRMDGSKIGQVLQYFAVHFVRTEWFVKKAIETMVLEVLVHIFVNSGGKGDSRDLLIDAPDLF